jgi:hypothetical protein
MTFTVLHDADVLYPNTLRDLLIRIAQSGTVRAKWTDAIQVHIDVRAVAASVRQIADSRINPPEALEDVLSQLERDGLVASVTAFRAA